MNDTEQRIRELASVDESVVRYSREHRSMIIAKDAVKLLDERDEEIARLKTERDSAAKEASDTYEAGKSWMATCEALKDECFRHKEEIVLLKTARTAKRRLVCLHCGLTTGLVDEITESMQEFMRLHEANCPNHPLAEIKKELKQLQQLFDDRVKLIQSLRDDLDAIVHAKMCKNCRYALNACVCPNGPEWVEAWECDMVARLVREELLK